VFTKVFTFIKNLYNKIVLKQRSEQNQLIYSGVACIMLKNMFCPCEIMFFIINYTNNGKQNANTFLLILVKNAKIQLYVHY